MDESEQQLREIVSRDENNSWALSFLGQVEVKQKKYEQASLHFEQALEKNNANHEAAIFLKGEIEDQATTLDRKIQKEPKTTDETIDTTQLQLAVEYKTQKLPAYEVHKLQNKCIDDDKLAVAEIIIEQWRNAHEEEQGARFSLELGRIYFWRGKTTEARKEIESVIDQEPNNSCALSFLGQIEVREERYKRAEELFDEAEKINPSNHEAQRFLHGESIAQRDTIIQILEKESLSLRDKIVAAELCQAIGYRAREAVSFLPTEMIPSLTSVIVQKLDNIILIQTEHVDTLNAREISDKQQELVNQREYSKAKASLQQWIKTHPDEPGQIRRIELGRILLLEQNLQEAKKEAELVLQLNPHENWALSLLGKVEAQLGNRKRAQALYDLALMQNPDNHEAQTELIELRKNTGTEKFTQDPGIEVSYGERTWRPVQTVIDLVQNHLDASTTEYEKKLLSLIGITEYKAEDEAQQKIIQEINKIKYATNQDQARESYANLRTMTTVPEFDEFQQQVQEINFQRPNMRLKVSNGEATAFVPYEEVRDLPETWVVIGFRVEDTGSGFDDRLLSMMGATTKKKSESKKGGLGEGLKMSATHLARAGADVRIVSSNRDSFWIARPEVQDQNIVFTGRKREQRNGITGSMTDVDLSHANFSAEVRTDILNALDPRKGEGLGKYALEYRGDEFIPLVNTSEDLTKYGVPKERVYVKGLLVQENANTLLSYNLGEKWAIQGRDRKTIKEEVLVGQIRQTLQSLTEIPEIISILNAVQTQGDQLELRTMTSSLNIPDEQKESWKIAQLATYGFQLGKTLYSTTEIEQDKRKQVEAEGHTIIMLPATRRDTISFFESIYMDDDVVSVYQFLENKRKKAADTLKALADNKQEVALAPENNEYLIGLRDKFKDTLQELSRESKESINLTILENLQFATGHKRRSGESPFLYNSQGRILLIDEEALNQEFETVVDFYVELLKTTSPEGTFNPITQDILTKLMGRTIQRMKPQITEGYKPFTPQQEIGALRGIRYSEDMLLQDMLTIEVDEYITIINAAASKGEVEKSLKQLEQYYRSKTPENETIISEVMYATLKKMGIIIYLDGKIYAIHNELDSNGSISLKDPTEVIGRVNIIETDNAQERQKVTLEYRKPNGLLLDLQEGESYKLHLTSEDDECEVVVKRKGGKFIAIKQEANSTDTIMTAGGMMSLGGQGRGLRLENNVLVIYPPANYELVLEKNNLSRKEELEEKNQGKNFLETNITLDYGGEVWQDPRRILLDALQNHVDAQKGVPPEISFTVIGSDGSIQHVQQSDEDIGKFGEGGKMLAASAVRQGVNMKLKSRSWEAQPTSYMSSVMDYESDRQRSFTMLGYNMRWSEQNETGSSSEFSLLPITVGETQDRLSSAQLADIQARLDTNSEAGRLWNEWMSVLDPRNIDTTGRRGLERFIAPQGDQEHTNDLVRILPTETGKIFEKGLLIPNGQKPMFFGYDINESIINTRERNAYNQNLLDAYLKNYYYNLTDKNVMKQILMKAKQNPSVDYYEYKFLGDYYYSMSSIDSSASPATLALWRQSFYEVFGLDAILSLQPEAQRLNAYRDRDERGSPGSSGENSYAEGIRKAVDNETHLENDNLQVLSLPLTTLYNGLVYSSKDHLHDVESQIIQITPEERENLGAFLSGLNTEIVGIVQDAMKDEQRAKVIRKIISDTARESREQEITAMDIATILIRNEQWPLEGMVEE